VQDDYLCDAQGSRKEVIRIRNPRKCPECGFDKVARILYGMQAYTPELEKDLEEGKVALGGCIVTPENPTWQCVTCGAAGGQPDIPRD